MSKTNRVIEVLDLIEEDIIGIMATANAARAPSVLGAFENGILEDGRRLVQRALGSAHSGAWWFRSIRHYFSASTIM